MDRPIAMGVAILGISKAIMNEFHFGFIKKIYGNRCRVALLDTDSLFYKIETDDWYLDMKPYWKDRFDTSDYPDNHFAGVPSCLNKKVMGLMKDEAKGKVITGLVGLRPKYYAHMMQDGEEEKKAKGVKKSVVANKMRFADYVKCLKGKKSLMTSFFTFRSRNHRVYTEKVTKVALSHQDTKRYLLEDGSHSTLPWGHYAIPREERLLE